MLYTSLDLPKALDYCHQLETEFDKVACSGGVFMENQSSSFGLRTKWLSTKNLLYPCNSKIVERRDKLYCYLLVTSHILPYVGGDWVKTADWCRKSEPGLGRDVLRVLRPRRLRKCGAEPRSHPRALQVGGQRAGVVPVRRSRATSSTTTPRTSGQRSSARPWPSEVPLALLLRHRIDPGTQHADVAGKRAACEQFAKGRDLDDCLDGAGAG